jgi:SAM-dependent methyltransferase
MGRIVEFYLIRKRLEKILKSLDWNSAKRVLDLGCGDEPYYHKFIKNKLVNIDNINAKKSNIIADACFLPVKSKSFDSVISVNSFYYFDNPFKASSEIARILKKGGKLILILPFFYPIHDVPTDKFRFTKYGLKLIFQDYFNIQLIRPIGGIMSLPSVILHSLIKGIRLSLPAPIKRYSFIFTFILYPFYFLFQLLSLLDFFDKTGRFPTYYFLLASKK